MPQPSRFSIFLKSKLNISCGNFIKLSFQKFSTIFLPKPSILKASLDTKCFNFSIAIFSHSYPSFIHLLTASFFFVIILNSLIVFEPHDGHLIGKINFDDCSIYNFLKESQIEDCANNSDPWGNRFAAAGVEWSSTANGGNVALFVDNWENYGYQDAIKVFAHEYFHVHQHGLLYYFEDEKLFGIPKAWLNDPEGTIFNDQPSNTYKMHGWIEEGGAEFAGPILATQYDNSIDARKLFEASLDEAKGVISTAASNGDTVSLRDYEFAGYLYESENNPNNGITREFAYQYTGGQWAHLYLWSLDDANYEKLMIEYYRNWAENESKNPGEGWRITFEDLFDMTVDDFYRDFDAFMLKDKSVQMSILPSNEEMQNRKVSK